MTIKMTCDRCEKTVPDDVPGAVRLKMGKREFIFHLCGPCQETMRLFVKEEFIHGRRWREIQ